MKLDEFQNKLLEIGFEAYDEDEATMSYQLNSSIFKFKVFDFKDYGEPIGEGVRVYYEDSATGVNAVTDGFTYEQCIEYIEGNLAFLSLMASVIYIPKQEG